MQPLSVLNHSLMIIAHERLALDISTCVNNGGGGSKEDLVIKLAS